MSIARQVLVAFLLLVVALAGGLGYLWLEPEATASQGPSRRGQQAALVRLVVATPRPVTRVIEAVGTTLASQAVDIVPEADGRIREIAFTPGARVEKGDVLARLDDEIERADLAESEAALKEARLALERAQQLRRNNTLAQASVEQLEAKAAMAAADYDRALRRLADREIRAPFAGIVGLRQVDVGARVDDNTVITTLDDLSEVQIEFSVPQDRFADLVEGTRVKATAGAFGSRVFEGVITARDSRIDPTARSFKARASLPNPDLALPAGMFMHVEVELESWDGLMIPEAALLAEGDGSYVYVVADNRAERRKVVPGLRRDGQVEITAGLEPGENVVIEGLQRLRDGVQVQVADAAGEEKKAPAAPAGPGSS